MTGHTQLRCTLAGLLIGAITTFAVASDPTYALKAAAINGVRIPGGPVSKATVAPGDRVVLEVYIRDWSPNGENLNAYQAQLDHLTFGTGPKGFIEPVDYSKERTESEDNMENCFVDRGHPRYVHGGSDALALTDSKSPGYRWLSVLIHAAGPVSTQNGDEFYCGTVNMEVSSNAEGTFTLDFLKDNESSGLRNADGTAVLPLAFEPLVLHVDAAIARKRPPTMAANLVRLIAHLNGPGTEPLSSVDVDRDGALTATDVLAAIDILNTAP